MELLGIIAPLLGIIIAVALDAKTKKDLEKDSLKTKEKNYNEIILKRYEKQEKGLYGHSSMSIEEITNDNEEYINRLNSVDDFIKSIRDNDYKGHVIFHGGCLECIAPEMINVGHCYGCCYFDKDFVGSPKKSIELKGSHPEHNFENTIK